MEPLVATAFSGIVMMFVSLFIKNKNKTSFVAVALLFVLTAINSWFFSENSPSSYSLFQGMLVFDSYSMWFNTLMAGIALLYVLLNKKHIEQVGNHVAEYYALLFFILVGTNLLNAYNNLLILFLGIEIISIPQYILAGSDKNSAKSSEASLKYFLMGAFSTGLLLMGIALLYGAMGTFNISEFVFSTENGIDKLTLAGIFFIIVALGFKVSAAPMHFWTPDVYDGAPTPFSSLMATIAKVAVFVGFLRLFCNSFSSLNEHWNLVIAVIIVLTLLIGNITAVLQVSVKRMLAYSSIAQAGFMLFSIFSINEMGANGLILYAVAYSIATIGMFAILVKLKDFSYDGFNGLAKKEPFLAFCGAIFLFSLAGIPLTGGFFAKYYMLTAALQTGSNLAWLVVFALIMAAVGVYYYFKLIWAMYFKPGNPEMAFEISITDKLLLGFSCVILIVVGILPDLFL